MGERSLDLVGLASGVFDQEVFKLYNNCIRSVKYIVNVKVCMQTSWCVSVNAS